jgi:hypothetical protein
MIKEITRREFIALPTAKKKPRMVGNVSRNGLNNME